MVGPLFYQEMLLGSRRSRDHVLRWAYGGWLVVQVFWFFFAELAGSIIVEERNLTMIACQRFTSVFLVQHFVLLMLTTPAFVAGGVTDEKTRGTLQYLLTTDLTSIHIIVGKLLGRIVQVLMLAAAGLPVLCFVGALGGAEPRLILGVILLTIEVAVGVSAATFLAAVWSRQTRDAVLGLYAFAVLALLFAGMVVGPLRSLLQSSVLDGLIATLGVPLRYFNPLYVLEPALFPGDWAETRELFKRLFGGLLAWGGLSLACLGLAAWRLRPAYIRQLEGGGRKRVVWWNTERPPVDEEPVRWKERQVEGLAPLPSLKRFPRWLALTAIAVVTILSLGGIIAYHLPPGMSHAHALGMFFRLEWFELSAALLPCEDAFLVQAIVAMLFLSLLVGVRCSGAVSGERERQSWEALLLTPLTAHQLVRGKVWGIMAVSYYYVLAYAVPALFAYVLIFTLNSVAKSPILALLSLIAPALWVVVTLLAMYYIGATGIWSSVRSRSSWRSLLSTLGFGYVGGFIVYTVTTPVLFIIAMIIAGILTIIDATYGTGLAPRTGAGFAWYFLGFVTASCLGLMLMFWLASRMFLNAAQKWVAERERTRHWHDEPLYRRPRRRVVRAR